jgi:hypothetical protein
VGPLLSTDGRGDSVEGVRMVGAGMDGTSMEAGWSETADAVGSDTGVDSVDGRTSSSSLVVSCFASSSLIAAIGSEAFESMLVLPASLPIGLRRAGLSGRDDASPDPLGLSFR